MVMVHFSLLRLFVFIPACLLSLASQGQYYFKKLTEENGLSDNRVTCFLKDKQGYLWIGTKNGLNRYDGRSFKTFKPGTGNSISSEVIHDIVQDASGKLWIATMSGLNIYDPQTNHWETMMPTGSDATGDLPSYWIWDLVIDEKNRIWIVSDVWALAYYDPATKKFTYYDWPAFKQQPRFDTFSRYRSIHKMTRKNENEWWLATTIGLFSVDIRSGQFQFYGSGYGASIKDLVYDSKHKIVFLVNEDGQLLCYEEDKKLYREIKPVSQAFPAVKWNRKKETEHLMLLSHPDGMLEVNTVTGEASIIAHRPSLSSSLLPGSTNNIYTDNAGITWIGTANGINYYDSRNRMADFIPLTATPGNKGEDGMGTALYDSIDNRYYVTSIHSKELFIIDLNNGKISSIASINGKALSACTNICLDRENNLWLLTETNIYRYSRQSQQFSLFPTPNNNREVVFHDFVEDKNGNYWIATWREGLYQYKTKEKKFKVFKDESEMEARNITSLAIDEIDHSVWIGTYNTGIYKYDLERDTMTNYSETPANPAYMQLNLIRDLETDAGGKLWLTAFGAGLYVHHHGKKYETAFSHIGVKDGLSNSNYFAITSDNRNRLWLLSGKGLSAVDTSGRFLYEGAKHPAVSFANYATNDRYPKRIFYNKVYDEIMVPVSGGLLLYYHDDIMPASGFPITLTDIFIDGKPVIYDSTYINGQTINIPYRSNSLSFRFAALDYTDPASIQYEYKLHQGDAAWKPLGNLNTVNFPDLSSGDYTFLVRAKDASGHISDNVASFTFRIRPPFWRTWWFYLLMAWCIGAIVYMIYKYQLNKKLEVERLRLRISRDLHDDIGSALTSINVLSKVALSKGGSDTEVSGYLSRIKDSTSHTMESMSDIVWAINPKNDKLEALMSRMKEFAADICEAQGIELRFDIPAELEKISLDLERRKNIFLVFKEAVNNAVKYSGCTLLWISFEKNSTRFRMTIHDNGKGFDRTGPTHGNGLYNMKERAIACGGDLSIESLLEKGTTVVLEIPITRFGGIAEKSKNII